LNRQGLARETGNTYLFQDSCRREEAPNYSEKKGVREEINNIKRNYHQRNCTKQEHPKTFGWFSGEKRAFELNDMNKSD
jgi:hypothetical protein